MEAIVEVGLMPTVEDLVTVGGLLGEGLEVEDLLGEDLQVED